MEYADFFRLPKASRLIWFGTPLFLERSPVSEAQRGVLSPSLKRLGLDGGCSLPNVYCDHFRSLTLEQHLDNVFKAAGVKEVVMTNDPFDPQERGIWKQVQPGPQV